MSHRGFVGWASYTPTWSAATSNPSLGNGSLSGSYYRAGSLVLFRIELTTGSTTSYGSGDYRLTVPIAADTDGGGQSVGYWLDASGGYPAATLGFEWISSTEFVPAMFMNSTASYPISKSVPTTWASGDILKVQGEYVAA